MSRSTLDSVTLLHLSLTGLSPSPAGLPRTLLLGFVNRFYSPNPGMHAYRFGLFPFRSPLLRKSLFVFFSSGYLDVSVHRVPLRTLSGLRHIHVRIRRVFLRGFPHSDIRGSWDICSSPRLFAAYHVFLRLSVPRHPPCALFSLTICSFNTCVSSALPSLSSVTVPAFFVSFLLLLFLCF